MQTASEADVAQDCARGVLVPLHPNVRRHSTLARPPEHLLPSTQAGHPKPAAHPWPTAQADTHNPPLQPPQRLVSLAKASGAGPGRPRVSLSTSSKVP